MKKNSNQTPSQKTMRQQPQVKDTTVLTCGDNIAIINTSFYFSCLASTHGAYWLILSNFTEKAHVVYFIKIGNVTDGRPITYEIGSRHY